MLTASTINQFAYVAEEFVEGKIKCLIVNFPGLGNTEMKNQLDTASMYYAHHGALLVYPFLNPWNWLNEEAVSFTDQILDVVKKKYSIENVPLISMGGSMGGYSSLAYTLFSKHKIDSVVANCPVTDLLFHYSERPDLPRTFHDCFHDYGDISEKLKSRSPVHQIKKMPHIPYFICHGVHDKSVNKENHSDKFVKLMKDAGKDITYIVDPLMHHCAPISYETLKARDQFVLDRIAKS